MVILKILLFYYCLLGVVLSENGPLRLSTEQSTAEIPHSGFVQMLVDQEWLDIHTSSNWTIAESDVVCKQLGYTQAIAILEDNYHCVDTRTIGKRINIDVECTGFEVNFSQCQSLSVNSSETEYSPRGVICAVPFSLRLINTSIQEHNSAGELEILLDSGWESFCGNTFNQIQAGVACRQFGYQYGQYTEIADIEGGYAYVNGTCSGHEFNLIACTMNDGAIQLTNCNTSVTLECFGPPSQPCHISTSNLACDAVSLTWSFVPSTVDQYYIRYRDVNEVSWSEIEELDHDDTSTRITAIINDLEPLLTYEVTIQGGSNKYGNGTFAEVVEVMPTFPGLLLPTTPQLISSNAENVNVSWEARLPNCSLLCIYGFDVHLTALTSEQVIVYTFTADQLTMAGGNHYQAFITKLEEMTLYKLKIRTLASTLVNQKCMDSSQIIYGPYSESMNLTTPEADSFGLLDLTLLKNPYVSLAFFVTTVVLIVLVMFLAILLCACGSTCRHQRKRKSSRIYQRRESNRDDNIYTAGDLSEQSYIPMLSSSVPNTLRITSRRVSNTPSINGRNLWIDVAAQHNATTFNNEEHELNRLNSAIIFLEKTDEKSEESNVKEDESDYDDDNPYDEISKVQQSMEERASTSEDDDENLYDEILTQIECDNSNAEGVSKNFEVKLPEAHRLSQIHSQDSTVEVPHVLSTIPPPREFAALPPVPKTSPLMEYDKRVKQLKGLSVSMCHLPLPPIPNSRPNFKMDTSKVLTKNISDGQGVRLESKEIRLIRSRDRRRTVAADTRERIITQRVAKRERKLSLVETETTRKMCNPDTDEQDNEAPYYSKPPRESIPPGQAIKSDDERSLSPEYETLLHPLSKITANQDRIIKPLSRPSRPPPPAPINNAPKQDKAIVSPL